MTTKVTVDAHAGWPVKVQALDQNYDHDKGGFDNSFTLTDIGLVEPGEVRDFYCTDSRKIVVTELRK